MNKERMLAVEKQSVILSSKIYNGCEEMHNIKFKDTEHSPCYICRIHGNMSCNTRSPQYGFVTTGLGVRSPHKGNQTSWEHTMTSNNSLMRESRFLLLWFSKQLMTEQETDTCVTPDLKACSCHKSVADWSVER
jgi:hypothetical protein